MNDVIRRIGIGAMAALCGLPLATAVAPSIAVAQNAPARPAPRPGVPATESAPAQAQPAPPIPTRTEILNFENWVVTCNEFAEGPRRTCAAALQIVQPNSNQVVFTWTIGLDPGKQMVAVMQTPTGVLILPGVELRVGKVPTHKIPFTSCDTGRCVATGAMDPALLREMMTTATAEAVIQGLQGNVVTFTIQLRGFDKAYTALTRS